MSDQAGEKKFDLTDRRRQQLREEGLMPKSIDVSTTITLAIGLGMLVTGGGLLIEYLRELMANSFVQLGHPSTEMATEQVGSVFSMQQIMAWAQQFGITPDVLQNLLAQGLPHVIDHLTPQGQVPSQPPQAADLASVLGRILGGSSRPA